MLKALEWLPTPYTIVDSLDARYLDYKSFLKEAYLAGSEQSPDPSTKNGAILVGEQWGGTYAFLSCACNRFAAGVEETADRLLDKTTKYKMVVHAEHNAILHCARRGIKTKGAVLFCPFYACSECAKAIIQAGIHRVVGHAQLMAKAAQHKTWVGSIIDGWEMMQEAGVECCLLDGALGVTTRFNQEDIAV